MFTTKRTGFSAPARWPFKSRFPFSVVEGTIVHLNASVAAGFCRIFLKRLVLVHPQPFAPFFIANGNQQLPRFHVDHPDISPDPRRCLRRIFLCAMNFNRLVRQSLDPHTWTRERYVKPSTTGARAKTFGRRLYEWYWNRKDFQPAQQLRQKEMVLTHFARDFSSHMIVSYIQGPRWNILLNDSRDHSF